MGLSSFMEYGCQADREEMKQHVRIGGTLLKSLGFAEEIVIGALYHHERFDGGE